MIGEINSSEEYFSSMESKSKRAETEGTKSNRDSHYIARRYTDDLDGERIMLELNMARKLYEDALEMHKAGNYFDALEKLSEAIY